MAIADYEPPKRKIALPDGKDFEVRALSAGDVAPIMAMNQDAIEFLVTQVGDRLRRDRLFDPDDPRDTAFFAGMISELVRSSPTLVGAVIAYAADEPSQYMQAMHLPLTVQAEALQAIAELTFTDHAALKQFIVSARNIWRGMVPARPVALASVA